jgi:hypothetical protein
MNVIGAISLLLAIVGLDGALSYTVSRERGDIGIRMALGANESIRSVDRDGTIHVIFEPLQFACAISGKVGGSAPRIHSGDGRSTGYRHSVNTSTT